jgi:peptide/nickel transport system substrate-binding protein
MYEGNNHSNQSLHVTRRSFLAGSAATLGLAGLGLPSAALAATPKKGGSFTVGLRGGGTGDTLDPSTYSSAQQIYLGYALRNNLTEIAPDGSLKPELAESWETDDVKVWSIKLRAGAEFHNGKSLAPEDVVASLNIHRGEDTKSGAASLLKDVVSLAADGPDRLRVELSAPNADFPFILSDYHFNIMPAQADGALDMGGVGTGGYLLEKYEAGVQASLRRNPSYWKDGAAHFDEGLVVMIQDSTAATTALVTGEVDAINDAEYKTLGMLSKSGDVTVESVPGGYHPTFAMRANAAPFDKNDVRLALKYGIDRQVLVDRVLKGYGIVANDHPIAPMMPFHDASIEQRPYDPDRAKFHLKQAGLDSLKVQLSASDSVFPGAIDAATLYREQARPSGLDIEIIREPNDGYWANVWLVKPFVTSAWGPRPTADMIFTQAYASGGAWNETVFENARFNELLVAARAELDEAKRSQMYGEMQRLVREESGAVIPFFRSYVYARRNGVGHSGRLAGNWPLDGYKAMERWWRA